MLSNPISELTLQIIRHPSFSNEAILYKSKSAIKKSPTKTLNQQLSKVFNSPNKSRNRIQSAQARHHRPHSFQILHDLQNRSNANLEQSFVSLTKIIPSESRQTMGTQDERSLHRISSKIDSRKPPVGLNIVQTLEDVAFKPKRSARQEAGFVTQNQSLIIGKEIINNKVDMTFSYNEKVKYQGRRSSRQNSPVKIIDRSPDDKRTHGRVVIKATDRNLNLRAKSHGFIDTEGLQSHLKLDFSSVVSTQKNHTEEKTTSTKQTPLIVPRKISNSLSPIVKQREHTTPEGIKPISLLSQMKNNKSPEKTQVKIKKGQPRFYLYQGFANEQERDKMTSFLQDEFVNMLLLNRYRTDLDKFQIKDELNGLSRKAEQNNDLRRKFYQFLHTGVPKKIDYDDNSILKELISPRGSARSPVQGEVSPTRKYSIQLMSDRLKEDEAAKERLQRKRENSNAGFDSPKKGGRVNSQAEIKSARSEEGKEGMDKRMMRRLKIEELLKQQTQMMNIIRLREEKHTLNEKLTKTNVLKGEEEASKEVVEDLTLAFKMGSEEEKANVFLKAAKKGDFDTIFLALQHRQSLVSETDETQQTALHLAAKLGHLEVCRLLIENGADVNARDIEDKHPLDYALKEKHPVLAQIMLEAKTGPLALKEIHYETLEEKLELFECLNEAQMLLPKEKPARRTTVHKPPRRLTATTRPLPLGRKLSMEMRDESPING